MNCQLTGELLYYRFFDVGESVDLDQSVRFLESTNAPTLFKLKKTSPSIVIEEVPLVIGLGEFQEKIYRRYRDVRVTAKVWSFGAVSICFSIPFSEMDLKELRRFAVEVDADASLHQKSVVLVQEFIEKIRPSIKNIRLWEQYEDYLIYNISSMRPENFGVEELLKSSDFYATLLCDKDDDPSKMMIAHIKRSAFQYSENDIVVLDWNSGFIYDLDDAQDLCDVIEFANIQLLEMRFYDSTLDSRLSNLYKSISGRKQSIFSERYNQIANESARLYIEFSEVIEKVENSFKVVGDVYYANIYRAMGSKLRFKDWQNSVDTKLKNLIDVAELLKGDVNERRNQFMELTVIILIAVEVVPTLYHFFMNFNEIMRSLF